MDSNFRFRASGGTPLTDRGVKPQATAAGCHFGEILPQGRDLDDGTVSQLFEELAGEMNRPSDRKRRISGYGDRRSAALRRVGVKLRMPSRASVPFIAGS